MTRQYRTRFFLGLWVPLSLACATAEAQFILPGGNSNALPENMEGFTVVGKGSVSAPPNRLEIDVEVSAASELSADAIVKYRDAKDRLREAFDALQMENLAIEERGLLVGEKGMEVNPYYFSYEPNRRTKAEVQLTRKLVVTCSNIREMDEDALLQMVAKLLDVAQDTGAQVGPQQNNYYNPYYGYANAQSGLVRFILDDFDDLEQQAYEAAIADARARAERLATLSQVKLGPISAVQVTKAPDLPAQTPQSLPIPNPDNRPEQKRLESSQYQEIAVDVALVVRFSIDTKAAEAGKEVGGE